MLKEKLIELLEADDEILNMSGGFLTLDRWDHPQYDFVGLILKVAGYSLQSGPCCGNSDCTDGVRLPLNAPLLDKKWVEYENLLGLVDLKYREIPALARQLWEAEYGEEKAKQLPFYEDNVPNMPSWWWDSVEEVRSHHIINYLNKDYPYELNGHTDCEE